MTVASTLPYRFKAGTDKPHQSSGSKSGSMAADAFHHRRSSHLSHKPFKTRHASKSQLKELAKGKTSGTVRDGGNIASRKTPHQQVMSKIDRRHHARQMMQQKAQQHAKKTSVFSGAGGAPRIVAVVGLSDRVDVGRAIAKLNEAVDVEAKWPMQPGQIRVWVERFRQNIIYVPVRHGDLFAAQDACRVADFVMLVTSAQDDELPSKDEEMILRTIESQGISNVLALVQDLNLVLPVKRRAQVTYGLKVWLSRYFAEHDKVLSLDSNSECANIVRSLCATKPKGVHWREQRSWMLVEGVQWQQQNTDGPQSRETSSVTVTGVVRGQGLKADRLVQVGDWGCFQIANITDAALPAPRKQRAGDTQMADVTVEPRVLEVPTDEQDSTDSFAPYQASMEDAPFQNITTNRKGVLIDDHHYFSEEEDAAADLKPKRLPRGTSAYQSAWYLGDISDSGSDFEDVDDGNDEHMQGNPLPQDGTEGLDNLHQEEQTEAGTEYPQSEMFLDPSPAQEEEDIQEYRRQRRTEAEDDAEFPDEIELHPGVLARERLAKYRGLKSLRRSMWDTTEDQAFQPDNWPRLLQIPDYARAKKQSLNSALVGGVQPGTRVSVELRDVPSHLRSNSTSALPLISLLPHEQKFTVVNISINLSSTASAPIKSKEELFVQYGSHRMCIRPLFSQPGATPNDVHKYQRFLHPGDSAIASFIGPVAWGAVPALFFQKDGADAATSNHHLVATGTTVAPSTSRVIAKRIILTGHPYKINRKVVTVRYMFFNNEDVAWFKALQLWTRRGRSGYIKESLGTHGYFKATFDGRINPQDAVGISLYKRVWPRQATPWVTQPTATSTVDAHRASEETMVMDA